MNIKKEILYLIDKFSKDKFAIKDFIPGVTPVPVSGKVLDSAELKNMVEASLDGWLTSGRFNKEFEEKISLFIGSKLAITVNSGSSANLVAFMTLTSPKLKEKKNFTWG